MDEKNNVMETVINEAAQPAMDIVEATVNKSGNTAGIVAAAAGGVMLVGACVVGVVKLLVPAIKKHAEQKKIRKPDEGTVVEPTQEQLDEVTQ